MLCNDITSSLNYYLFSLRNRNLRTTRAPLKSQAHQGTSLFTSAAMNQMSFPKGSPRWAQVRFPKRSEVTEYVLRWVSFRMGGWMI